MKFFYSLILVSGCFILNGKTANNSSIHIYNFDETSPNELRIRPHAIIGSIEIAAGVIFVSAGTALLFNSNPWVNYQVESLVILGGIGTVLIVDGVRRIQGLKYHRPKKRF